MCIISKNQGRFLHERLYIVLREKQLFRFTSISVNFIEFKHSNGCVRIYWQFWDPKSNWCHCYRLNNNTFFFFFSNPYIILRKLLFIFLRLLLYSSKEPTPWSGPCCRGHKQCCLIKETYKSMLTVDNYSDQSCEGWLSPCKKWLCCWLGPRWSCCWANFPI